MDVKANMPLISNRLKLAIGLGNPGQIYENTYHNAGQLLVEHLKSRRDGGRKWKAAGSFAYVKLGSFTAAKSLVFMNEAGQAVAEAARFFKVKLPFLAVAHDDSDLKLGEWKISFGQGSAGHKGVESVISELGTKNFWRIRLGIRPRTEIKRKKAETFVLKKISAGDKAILNSVFKEICAALVL